LYYFHSDHLGSSTFLSDALGKAYEFILYLPYGETMAHQKVAGYSTPYKFTSKEQDEETGLYYFGARYYDPSLSIWHGVDPLAGKMPEWSPYSFSFNNPLRFDDPDGRIPFPVNAKYKGENFRIDSWFGPRNTGLSYASKNHKGLDFNFGGGRFDYGAPVLTTHTGTVSIKDDMKGNTGRMVTVTSPDGSFRTKYMHLKEINVKDGDKITEATQIGEIGGSRKGKEFGGQVHLHYQIEKYNAETKTWDPYNPTEGNGNSKDNVVDPQSWITPAPAPQTDMSNTMPQDNTRVNIVLPIIKKEEVKKENTP
jgi:RHS repeat-associated protein